MVCCYGRLCVTPAAPVIPSPVPPQFSLLHGFWQLLFRQNEYQIVILGIDHAGKTVKWAGLTQLAHDPAPRADHAVCTAAAATDRSRADQGCLHRPRAFGSGQDCADGRAQHWQGTSPASQAHLLGSGRAVVAARHLGEVSRAPAGHGRLGLQPPAQRARPRVARSGAWWDFFS